MASIRVTRSRRSLINCELSGLPATPRRSRISTIKPEVIVISSDSEDDCKDETFRKVPINPILKARKSVVRENSTDLQKELIEPISTKKGLQDVKEEEHNEHVDVSVPTIPASSVKIYSTPKKKKPIQDIENYGQITPPKLKKIDPEVNLLSPSSLLQRLELCSPKKPPVDPLPCTTFQNARRALHSSVPVDMPERETEHEQLRQFLKKHLLEETSGTLYISGPPGTGKTASLSKILKEPEIENSFKEVYVNCTAIKSSGSIYMRIIKELGIKTSGRTEKECSAAIEEHLAKKHKMILLVLDEIDQLESKKQSVLYTIFEWPSRVNSRLILVGIANALDLTDRILPRLQARCELKPQLMHFAPYTKPQIVNIFTSRLKAAGVLDLFQPVAVQMLAGKVAAISGDIRRALDIGRRVVEIVEQHKKQEALKSIENIDNQTIKSSNDKAVGMKHVVDVLNSVYGTTNNFTTDEGEDSFPLQQKIVICTLLLIMKKAKNKDVTIGKLHDIYRKVCAKRNLLAVDQAEFVGLCSLVETKGIIHVLSKKEPRLYKVTLQWDDEEVSNALRDKQLMAAILQDTSVLGKL